MSRKDKHGRTVLFDTYPGFSHPHNLPLPKEKWDRAIDGLLKCRDDRKNYEREHGLKSGGSSDPIHKKLISRENIARFDLDILYQTYIAEPDPALSGADAEGARE
jgi:hypothetical protein